MLAHGSGIFSEFQPEANSNDWQSSGSACQRFRILKDASRCRSVPGGDPRLFHEFSRFSDVSDSCKEKVTSNERDLGGRWPQGQPARPDDVCMLYRETLNQLGTRYILLGFRQQDRIPGSLALSFLLRASWSITVLLEPGPLDLFACPFTHEATLQSACQQRRASEICFYYYFFPDMCDILRHRLMRVLTIANWEIMGHL
jgi:hypothetical protein